MRLTVILPLLTTLLIGGQALAADTTKAPSAAQSAQRQKMTDCNQQATGQSLKGDERKNFMSHCLKAETKPDKKMTEQQNKMKNCNADAGKKQLKGDARKAFMSTCLKKAR
ncbi:PsiF family protein [Hafnia psychrotolerans]|uniref:Phosphate starvation-inducible protein PsiF n=1 Tax=Hafnia psychrotolerans TaxID=1477018 RepID=A0ABQ1FUV3_9GAMM|nr:PsiF family protein [Hafnia psychrotolerans]GGA31463.1 phosphate starvation-inducible protein PsiF [Hafnia psychrotolerans]